MPVNALHRDAYRTMQDILKQMDIRTELKMKLNELETVLEENEKIERKADELKFTATEEYNTAARRVEDIEIATIKEEIKQKKQRIKHNIVYPFKRVHIVYPLKRVHDKEGIR
jgi:predicted nuclease with TOPRIM domain